MKKAPESGFWTEFFSGFNTGVGMPLHAFRKSGCSLTSQSTAGGPVAKLKRGQGTRTSACDAHACVWKKVSLP